MSDTPFHYLGSEADDDADDNGDDKPKRVPIDYPDDGRGVPLMGPEELAQVFADHLMSGEQGPIRIPLNLLNQEAIDELVESGGLPPDMHSKGMNAPIPNTGRVPPSLKKVLSDRGVVSGSADPAAPFPPVNSGNPKDALGDAKPDLSLVPPAAILYMARGFMDGAKKYGPYNWRENAVRARVYTAAALRHIAQFQDGENVDPTSGVPHIAHALACLAIIADAFHTGNLIDDRPRPGAAGDMIRDYVDRGSFI